MQIGDPGAGWEENSSSIENNVRWSLENMFLKCPKSSLQQITSIAKQLGLVKDVVRVWFCNWRQNGKRSSTEYSQPEEFEATGTPLLGGWGGRGGCILSSAPGPHIGTPGYGRPHFTTLYSVPFPVGEAFPSVPVTTLALPCIQTEAPALPGDDVN